MLDLLINSNNTHTVLTISAKGWVVIPAEMRKKYGLSPGSNITIVDYGGVLSLIPLLPEPIAHGRGLLAGKTSLTKALLQERQLERNRD